MGVWRHFPYSNFHELNEDQIIEIVIMLQEEWNATKNEWASYKDFIDNYFKNLDVSKEVLAGLLYMAETGKLNEIMDPTIATTTTTWLNEHVTPTTPIIDNSLTIEGAGADAKVTGTKINELFNNLIENNSFNIVKNQPLPPSTTRNGVTYDWHDDYSVTLTGTASPASFSNIYYDLNNLPLGIVAGNSIEVEWISDPALLNIIWYDDYGEVIDNKYIKGIETLKVPDDAVGCVIRVYVVSGRSVDDTVTPLVLSQGANLNIKYIGNVEQNGYDLNELPSNTIGVCEGDEEYLPITSAGYIITIGSIAKMQLFINSSRGRMYYRFATINGIDYTYGEWVDLPTDWAFLSKSIHAITDSYTGSLNDCPPNTITINSGTATDVPVNAPGFILTTGSATGSGVRIQYYMRFSDGALYYRRALNLNWVEWSSVSSVGNAGASLLSIGNSILSGSVWTEETQGDHIASYGNAPYSVIANAINVAKENVVHELYSSTGLLYDAGRGSFLNIIKSKDISNYDVILTHLWIQDMNNYPLGSIDSTPNDGSIAGAVLELVNHIKTQNKRAQLILCSVPPCDTSIKGDNVYTGNFNNGKSLADLDELMNQLAENKHFIYITWQNLNFAYYWQDLTWNGNNVHLASESAYRVFGAHAGGIASSKINF